MLTLCVHEAINPCKMPEPSPNEEAMAAALIAGATSGGVTGLKTSVAITAKEAMKAFKAAGPLAKSFKSPGK
jgi:hypothetical protein